MVTVSVGQPGIPEESSDKQPNYWPINTPGNAKIVYVTRTNTIMKELPTVIKFAGGCVTRMFLGHKYKHSKIVMSFSNAGILNDSQLVTLQVFAGPSGYWSTVQQHTVQKYHKGLRAGFMTILIEVYGKPL